jgi:hypothetical protein
MPGWVRKRSISPAWREEIFDGLFAPEDEITLYRTA